MPVLPGCWAASGARARPRRVSPVSLYAWVSGRPSSEGRLPHAVTARATTITITALTGASFRDGRGSRHGTLGQWRNRDTRRGGSNGCENRQARPAQAGGRAIRRLARGAHCARSRSETVSIRRLAAIPGRLLLGNGDLVIPDRGCVERGRQGRIH